MPRYKTTVTAFVEGILLGENVEFSSDAVPGRTWRPIDKGAKAAVRERDEAAKAAKVPVASEREVELEKVVESLQLDLIVANDKLGEAYEKLSDASARINELQAEVEALTAPPVTADKK